MTVNLQLKGRPCPRSYSPHPPVLRRSRVLSFFDEGDEPRTTRTARAPRRPSGARSAGGSRPAGSPPPDLARRRQVTAIALGLAFVILLALLINSCADNRRQNALRDFNQEVRGLATESDETARAFFEVLGDSGTAPLDQQTRLNQLRAQAEQQAESARGLSVPDDMRPAHQNLVLALDFRADGIGKVARQIPAARSDEEGSSEQPVQLIAGAMQLPLASDVVWSQRVAPFIVEALDDADVGGQRVARSQVLTDLGWLEPGTVADRLGAQADGGGSSREPAPGTHGHGLESVSVGDTRLAPGAPNRIPASNDLTFNVAFANQGENNEENVRVRVRLRPETGRPITVTETVDQTNAGSNATAAVRLGQAPPIGVPVTVEVEVLRVPGEEKVDNNRQSYTVLFTRG